MAFIPPWLDQRTLKTVYGPLAGPLNNQVEATYVATGDVACYRYPSTIAGVHNGTYRFTGSTSWSIGSVDYCSLTGTWSETLDSQGVAWAPPAAGSFVYLFSHDNGTGKLALVDGYWTVEGSTVMSRERSA